VVRDIDKKNRQEVKKQKNPHCFNRDTIEQKKKSRMTKKYYEVGNYQFLKW